MATLIFVSYNLRMVANNSGEGIVPSVSVCTACNCILDCQQNTNISTHDSGDKNILKKPASKVLRFQMESLT